MSHGSEQRITGSEAARVFSHRVGEIRKAKLIRTEVLARLAVSLAITQEPSLEERSKSQPLAELTELLNPIEISKLPTAEDMLKTIEKGYNG